MPQHKRGYASLPDLPPLPTYHSAIGTIRRLLFGRALPTSRAGEEKLPNFLALPILSSNALSSNAYAGEAILGILMLKGSGALHLSIPICFAVCALLLIVSLSYIQIIHAYPNGGGAYPVSRENLSATASLIAGASLMVDYMLTVAVSVAAGVAAIITIYPPLHHDIVPLCLWAILVLTLANLRGVRESGALFAWPTYVFIVAIMATIVSGLYGLLTHQPWAQPAVTMAQQVHATNLSLQAIGWYLILQAFSQGCAALTGLEAVSNTVPLFQAPAVKNATWTMIWMGILAVIMFYGLTYIADGLGALPMSEGTSNYRSVVGQVADKAWSPQLHWMLWVVQVSTAIVLLLAANTAFAGFPQLASMMARDGYLPRQLAAIGDRLAYSNGILVLAVVASLLIVAFKGRVEALLPMYAIGVFIGFTLAQTGMVIRWNKLRTKGWETSIAINAVGALSTGAVSVIIGVSKFANGQLINKHLVFGPVTIAGHVIGPCSPHYGTWIVLVLVPILVTIFSRIHRHYVDTAVELALDKYEVFEPTHNTVLVLVSRLHRGVAQAVAVAKMMGKDVRGVCIEIDPADTPGLKEAWEEREPDIPLVIMQSPYRSLIGPLLRYIDAVQHDRANDVVTVVVPELVSRKWWHRLLHNQTGPLLRFALSNRRDVVVTTVRYFHNR
ncbi:MAG TPA: APC family permease [Capsulimonadaceae bacterium]|jgi:amino acid transporter